MTPTWIAEEDVIFLFPNGQRTAGRIAVAQPAKVGDEPAECHVTLDGLGKLGGPIYAESTLQALLLGIRFLGMRLHDFVSRGGRVLLPDDDTDFELEALFGPLLCAAPNTDRDFDEP